MSPDVELSGIIAQHHGVAEKFVRLNAAPQSALGGDTNRVGRHRQRGEAEPVEVCQPSGLIAELRLRLSRQASDQRRRQMRGHRVALIEAESGKRYATPRHREARHDGSNLLTKSAI